MSSLKKECALASAGILVLLGVLKVAVPAQWAATIAAGVQLYVPIILVGRFGITNASLGLVWSGWRKDVLLALGLGVATIVPFGVGHHFWQTEVGGRAFAFALPAEAWALIPTQLAAVAFPEELFFRGYLQGRLETLWPARRRLFGTPFGLAILTASAVFALAHFVGEWNPARLAPFFPALLFGLLRTRTRSIVAPIVYHAFCNVLSQLLFACYHTG